MESPCPFDSRRAAKLPFFTAAWPYRARRCLFESKSPARRLIKNMLQLHCCCAIHLLGCIIKLGYRIDSHAWAGDMLCPSLLLFSSECGAKRDERKDAVAQQLFAIQNWSTPFNCAKTFSWTTARQIVDRSVKCKIQWNSSRNNNFLMCPRLEK